MCRSNKWLKIAHKKLNVNTDVVLAYKIGLHTFFEFSEIFLFGINGNRFIIYTLIVKNNYISVDKKIKS